MSLIAVRKGFTLIELIIVIAIMGMVAALVSSRLTHIADHSSALTPSSIKNYLSAFNSNKRLELFCYDNCTQCDLWEGDKKVRSSLNMESNGSLRVRQFDRFGHLVYADPAIHSEGTAMRDGCFEFFLYPDGVSSSLILEAKGAFIVYSPLSDSVIQGDEEQIRTSLYDPSLMNKDSYYGNR
ncbi:prepilin-type N-terminal cleavage/methylation domain-containing protein [Sulfuricurvum sp.]|uniref:type II secretion system protein n=1 Tax=Sulfuricurvum sp. TaxID=2025608 RepID=UPI002D43B7DC|nr:prepilin-type N-terminal cleavage/methylation domain-containing protein [Sulfuricurvum sp.]HZF69282.1 prepilin-type N-terminal cleavage/methylation domain-containing protein [Sulfuricurvum sp.]